MPDFISGVPIGPEQLAAGGNVQLSPAGGKEIHFDSGAMRAQYESANAGAGFSPEIVEGAPVDTSTAAPVEPLSPEVVKAMMSGSPPPVTLMPPATKPASPVSMPTQWRPTPPANGAVELRVPVGGGIVASVTFSGQPRAKHWKRLLAHIEIEADPDNEFEEVGDGQREEAVQPRRSDDLERSSKGRSSTARSQRRARGSDDGGGRPDNG